MAGTATEQVLITKLGTHFEAIDLIKTAFPFAQNPDFVAAGLLPATLFHPPRSQSELGAHHNAWKNTLTIMGATLVVPRKASGGKLKWLENDAIQLMQDIRTRFQREDVVRDLLSAGLSSAYTFECTYGAGGRYLTHMDVEYIGVLTSFTFTEIG